MTRGFILLCLFVAVAGWEPNCQYQLNQCYGRMHDIEQKMNKVEANLNVVEGRQSAFTQALSREVSTLDQDTKTVKSVVNTLVEDSVKIHGDIRLLKGHGEAIVGLRKQVRTVTQATEGEISRMKRQVNEVSQSLQKESEAANKITELISNQMRKNDLSLQEVKTKTERLESKINDLQKAGSAEGIDVVGMLNELSQRLDRIEGK